MNTIHSMTAKELLESIAERLDDLEAAINRHDQTLYEFVVKPVRDKEDADDEKK